MNCTFNTTRFKYYLLTFFIINCYINFTLYAQTYNDTLNWTYFTTKDGLCDDWVTEIMEDNKGRIWAATVNNVSFFENNKWTTYTQSDGLAGSRVSGIAQDSTGIIWFATSRGVTSLDGKKWKSYTTNDGLLNNECFKVIVDQKNRIWVCHWAEGVSMFDGKKWHTYTMDDGLAANYTQGIIADSKGTIWTTHMYGGLSAYRGNSWTAYSDLADLLPSHISIDQADTLWLGTRQGAYRYIDGKLSLFLDTSNGLPGNKNGVGFIRKDPKNRVWLQAAFFGLAMVDKNKITVYDSLNKLPDNNPQAIYFDSRGDIWISSQGLVRISKHTAINSQIQSSNTFNLKNLTARSLQSHVNISFILKKKLAINMSLYKLNGSQIYSMNSTFSAGFCTLNLPTQSIAIGQYLLVMRSELRNTVRKKILCK